MAWFIYSPVEAVGRFVFYRDNSLWAVQNAAFVAPRVFHMDRWKRGLLTRETFLFIATRKLIRYVSMLNATDVFGVPIVQSADRIQAGESALGRGQVNGFGAIVPPAERIFGMGVARAIARRVRNRIVGVAPPPPPPPPKTWARSQQYEFSAAQSFMESDWFKDSIAAFAAGRSDASTGHVDALPFREFFNEDRSLWDNFKDSVQGKTGVDIGPCVWSPMANWSFLSRRIAIEPLGEKVRKLQAERYGCSFFDAMELRSVGADVFMPDLESAIDGVIYCRNMIDHTPSWPVVMANLGLYAARGCHLLLWADYNHDGMADEGHYEICETQDDFKRIVRSLGFEVLREFEDKDRQEHNWGCVAIKR